MLRELQELVAQAEHARQGPPERRLFEEVGLLQQGFGRHHSCAASGLLAALSVAPGVWPCGITT